MYNKNNITSYRIIDIARNKKILYFLQENKEKMINKILKLFIQN